MADRLQDFFDSTSNIFTVFGIVGIVGLIISLIGYAGRHSDVSDTNTDTDPDLRAWRIIRKSSVIWCSVFIPLAMITWFMYIATPSKRDALMIIAGGAVGNFITSDSSARELPADITNFLRAKIVAETKALDMEEIFPELTVDTLKNKTKEELLEILHKQKK